MRYVAGQLRKGSYRRGLLRASARHYHLGTVKYRRAYSDPGVEHIQTERAEWLSVLKNYGKDAHLVLCRKRRQRQS